MTDLAQALSEIKSLPDHALRQELTSPKGMLPGFLVLSELHDRKNLRGTSTGGDFEKPKSLASEYMYAEGGTVMRQQQIAAINPWLQQIQAMKQPKQAMEGKGQFVPQAPQGLASLVPQQPGMPQPIQARFAGGGQISLRDYLYQRAPLWGIDPRIAEQFALGEGGFSDTPVHARGSRGGYREPSHGTFQLLIGGPGTGYPTGMGNEALAHGIDPRKPEDQYRAMDFALQQASQRGWTPWTNTMNKLGYGQWTGINRGGGGVAPETMAYTGNGSLSSDPNMAALALSGASGDAANIAATMTAAENASTPMQDYFLATQLMQQNEPEIPPPAPMMERAAAEPLDVGMTSHTPDWYMRRRGAYG